MEQRGAAGRERERERDRDPRKDKKTDLQNPVRKRSQGRPLKASVLSFSPLTAAPSLYYTEFSLNFFFEEGKSLD